MNFGHKSIPKMFLVLKKSGQIIKIYWEMAQKLEIKSFRKYPKMAF